MHISLDFYDPKIYPPVCLDGIEAVNRTALQILTHVTKMKLQEFHLRCARSTTLRAEDVLSIIERNVNTLDMIS